MQTIEAGLQPSVTTWVSVVLLGGLGVLGSHAFDGVGLGDLWQRGCSEASTSAHGRRVPGLNSTQIARRLGPEPRYIS